ncbi:Pex25/Pex27 [Kluyveromyces lactis]|nr:Pex25/Pex27 [Kluyveromyces lactis]
MNDDFYRPPHIADVSIETEGFEISARNDSTMIQSNSHTPTKLNNLEVTVISSDSGSSGTNASEKNGTLSLQAGESTMGATSRADKTVHNSSKHSDSVKLIKVMNKVDILKAVFATLTGKDRIAKIFKYVIDILRIFIQRSMYYNNKDIDMDAYLKVFSKGNLLTILRNPRLSGKLFLSSSSKLFLEKGALVSSQLGFYRQIMRCGGTPFRLHHWYQKLIRTFHASQKSSNLHSKGLVWYKNWWNEESLSEFIDLYYGIMDELMLLYKLKLWSNKSMYGWVSKHEALSWYYDIILGLKKNWEKLQSIKQQEFELKIQYQVRQRALELSSKLNATPSVDSTKNTALIKQTIFESFKQDNLDLELEVVQKLKNYQYEKRIVKFDLTRLFFDFLADTTDVFSIKTPPGTYAILSLCSGVLGFSKLCIQAKEQPNE